jgi:hypothetical protein
LINGAEQFKSERASGVPLSVLIFSKNRACQCDGLLRSVRDHFHASHARITVLFRATTPAFQRGYDLLIRRRTLDGMVFRPEKTFRDDVNDIVGGCGDDSFVMFLVDDDVVFRPCDVTPALDVFSEKHLFISLRADESYPSDIPPVFISKETYLEWKWNYSKGMWVTWNYPFSVDGNIYHARHIKKALKSISFKAPNSLEGRLHAYRHAWWVKRISKALAPGRAVVFNNPINRVQEEGETWHENITPEFLNDTYLNGMQIDNRVLYDAAPSATHFAVPPTFVRQE